MNSAQYWQERLKELKEGVSISTEEKLNRYIAIYQNTWKEITDNIKELSFKIEGGNYTRSEWYKYNRMLKLEKEIHRLMNELVKKEIQFTKDIVKESYESALKELYKDFSIEFDTINKNVVDSIVNNPWAGQYFSKRIWNNIRNFEFVLNDILVRGINQGKSIAQITEELKLATSKTKSQCERLVRTEVMQALNRAAIDTYTKINIKYVQRVETVDIRICSECLKAHGKIYKLGSEPHLPSHPRCRGTYIPVVDGATNKEYKELAEKQRKELKEKLRIEKEKQNLIEEK